MNPSKIEEDSDPFFLPNFHHHHHNNHQNHHSSLSHHRQTTTPLSPPTTINPSFSLLFHPSSPSSSSDSLQTSPPPPQPPPRPQTQSQSQSQTQTQTLTSSNDTVSISSKINPQPHISSQFYTFNTQSHALMISCLLQNRLATTTEIQSVTPIEVLKSWRSVWKDRNEDTAYLTAWKRIQDKLNVHIDGNGDLYLCFKNNSSQFVSHFGQWQDIVVSSHSDDSDDSRHLGLRETVEKIRKRWTVGAKFYGIPESFIRVCIASCGVCSSGGGRGGGGFSKRRRFEYTESFDLPAKEVPNKLQQLAKKHNVVLCIRQKYIRYKPFMAEVKDYACHRAGEPGSSKKSKVLKREPYASKRCGCGFRIRAIVPIANYNEKDKSFVYQEEGMAVFKLYAVHTGHEPGPLDGNARIMHRVVGHKGVFLNDQETEYGVNEELENDSYMGRDEGDLSRAVLNQVQELKSEVGLLESRISKLPPEVLESVSQELYHIVNKVRELGYGNSKSIGLDSDKTNSDVMLIGDGDLPHWNDPNDDTLYRDGKDTDLIEEDVDSFGQTLGNVVTWDQMRVDCHRDKDMIDESCKPDKWLNASEFDEKSFLGCDDSKLTKPSRHDGLEEDDVGLDLQVDSFYPENPKWYDSPCGLDSSTDCGDSEF